MSVGPQGPPGQSGFGTNFQDFVATANQTAFVLAAAPADATKVLMMVDTFFFYPSLDLTVAGNTVTWLPLVNFPMKTGQAVRIYY